MPTISKIKNIKAREILDSRGNPTVEVDLETTRGVFTASVPSGASAGKYEAAELRDKGMRYGGKGVFKAVRNIKEKIFPAIKGKNVLNQGKIDQILIDLDGTKNKAKLGANAILPVSVAVCRAGAKAKGVPLYKYISQLSGDKPALPEPCFNIINGGVHASNNLDIQEFMIIPRKKFFSESLWLASEIYKSLKEILKEKLGKAAVNVGDEGGFTPQVSKTKEAINFIMEAISRAGNGEVKLGLDCAASQFHNDDKYILEDNVLFRDALLMFYGDLVKNYPIIFLEDPFAEDDWQGFSIITKEFAKKGVDIFGDDLTTTNVQRIKEAKKKKACSGVIIKPNQIGTVTETLEAVKTAKESNWKIMVSHRSGDTCDDFIADLAVGIGADYIKSGAPARGERLAKYNRLLKIEEEIKK